MEKHNTVHAIFASGAKEAEIIDDVWQYDFGQTLQISGLSLPPTIEIHYANKGRDAAIPQVGVTKDGITTAPIPNEILSEKGSFTAYIFLTDGKSGETCYTITGYINKRPAMKGFNAPEDQEIFHEAIEAVNKAAERAESAETKATAAANQTTKDAKQTATDRAEVERLVESVSGIGEQVTKVENLTKQAQTSATNAALSEQAAKTAETNAQAAQAGAETAEGNAELAERNTKASEQAVEKAKQLVTQMGQEVLDNKNHVDQTVQAFDQTAHQAVADVNNAGQMQTERVQSAGNTAVESIKTAQGTATQAVETAKTEAINVLQTEGTTQTGNVTTEGTKQVQAVQAAAQEIVADREQIAQNKADVTALKEDLGNLSPAIVDTATGESIVVEDSSGNEFRGLNVYGKSTQVVTTGAQLFDKSKAFAGWVRDDGSVNNTGAVGIGDNILSEYIPFEAGKQYFCGSNFVWMYNAEKGFVKKADTEFKGGVFTAPDNAGFFVTGFSVSAEKALDKIDEIMINIGPVQKPYEPYTGGKPSPSVEYPQEIESAGDKGQVDISVLGANLAFSNKAGALDDAVAYLYGLQKFHIKAKRLSGTSQVNCRFHYESGMSGNDIAILSKGESKNETIRAVDAKYPVKHISIYAVGVSGDNPSTELEYLMVNPKNIPYEPYKPAQKLIIPTPGGLLGIPVSSGGNYTDKDGQQWVCDEIDLAKNERVQWIENIDLKKQKWNKHNRDDATGGCYFASKIEKPALFGTVVKGTASNIGLNKNPYNMADDCVWILTNRDYSEVRIGLADGAVDSTEKLANLLNGIPEAYAMYCLLVPAHTPLSPEVIESYKKLHTNYPVTTVLNDAGAGMSMSYVADTKNYINKKFEELNAKIVNTQIALL